MSFHNKPKYQIPELIQSLKDHGLEHDKPSQLADSFRTGWIAGRAAVQAAQPEAVGWKSMPTVEELADRIASMLHGTYHCNRVWNAWTVGTMSQDDFEPLDESETPTEIAAEIHAMLASAPTEPMSAPTAEPVAWAIIASNTGRMCQATLNKYEIEGHNPAHIVPLYATPPSAATPEPSDAERLSSEQIEEGAKELSKCMDYPWEHMPHTGRSHMRETVKAIDAAIRATKGGKL